MIDLVHLSVSGQLSLSGVFAFPGFWSVILISKEAFCLFPSFSPSLLACAPSFLFLLYYMLVIFLFKNIFPNLTFNLPCCQHCLNPLASSCLSFHGLCGRKSWLSLFPMDLNQSGHLCLVACLSVEWSTVRCLQVSSRSLFIHLCHGERKPASC